MVRRAVPARIADDRYFPVRVRIAVPPSGFGSQLNTMHGWLNMHTGRGNFAIHGARMTKAQGSARTRRISTSWTSPSRGGFACGLAVVEPLRRGFRDAPKSAQMRGSQCEPTASLALQAARM
jgi:hypothetical protein